jgi:hypothetical protein
MSLRHLIVTIPGKSFLKTDFAVRRGNWTRDLVFKQCGVRRGELLSPKHWRVIDGAPAKRVRALFPQSRLG